MNNRTTEFDRERITEAIIERLDPATIDVARSAFPSSRPTPWFVIDGLVPHAIRRSFRDHSQMRESKSLREHKFVAAEMDRQDPQAEEALFAFHDDRVVDAMARLTGLGSLHADPQLYAGGISLMRHGKFRVSNYYFSEEPLGGHPYFRVTSFRGRLEQPFRDLALRLDGALRQGIRRLFPGGIAKTTHIYDRTAKSID